MASSVALIKLALSAFSNTSTHKLNTSENSWHCVAEVTRIEVSSALASFQTVEFTHNLSLERLGLGRRHLFCTELEDLFGKKLEDDHVVLADGKVGLRRGDDLGDEGGPRVRPVGVRKGQLLTPISFLNHHLPLLLEDLNENEVELVHVGLLLPERRLVSRTLDDDTDDEVADSAPLILGEDLPPTLDELVHDLKGDVLGLRVARALEDLGDLLPRIGVLLELSEDGLRLCLLYVDARGRVSEPRRDAFSEGGRNDSLPRLPIHRGKPERPDQAVLHRAVPRSSGWPVKG